MHVRINAVGRWGFARLQREIKGKENANVFPEPVGALQQISFPSIASGIDSFELQMVQKFLASLGFN